MFFEEVVLNKKRALGKLWLAAHWEKKITKEIINETDIKESVDRVQNPKAAMSLRLSGHLLLGIVRIYFKKIEFLYKECNDAMVKIKMAFRPANVDLPEAIANFATITMPETFGDFEIILPSDIISTDLLPEAEQGLLQLNLARIVQIQTIEPPESPRDRSQLIYETSQPELFPMSELDLLDPSRESTIIEEPRIKDILHPPEQPEPPEFQPQPPEQPPEEQVPPPVVAPPVDISASLPPPQTESTTSVSEKDLAIEQIADLQPTLLERKRLQYKQDRRTELTESIMSKTIRDTASLLRPLERAPPTRELMRFRKIELASGPIAYFNTPNDPFLNPTLSKLMERTMMRPDLLTRDIEEGGAGLPPVTEDSQEKVRQEEEEKRKREEEALAIQLQQLAEQAEIPDRIPGDIPGDVTTDVPGDVPGTSIPSVDFDPTIESQKEKSRSTREEDEDEEAPQGLVITHRTAAVHTFLGKNFELSGNNPLSFFTLLKDKKRNTAAVTFFELLNIRSKLCINVQQDEHYGDIIITKTTVFDRLNS